MRFIAGAILVLAGAVLVGAAMIGVDVRNTGPAPYTESRLGYAIGGALALVGAVVMAVGWRGDSGSR
jgi:hypothetical protein